MGGLNWDRARAQRLVGERGVDPIANEMDTEAQRARRAAAESRARPSAEARKVAGWRRQDLADLQRRVAAMAPAERRNRYNSLRNTVRRLTSSAVGFEKVWREQFAPLVPPPPGRRAGGSAAAAPARRKARHRNRPPAAVVVAPDGGTVAGPSGRRHLSAAAMGAVRAFPAALTQKTAAQVLAGTGPADAPAAIRTSRWWAACRGVPVSHLRAIVAELVDSGAVVRAGNGQLTAR
jgi:hypothetical protein